MKKNTNKLLTAGLVLLLALFVLCAGALKIIPSNIFGYKGSEEEFRTDMERISEDVIEEEQKKKSVIGRIREAIPDPERVRPVSICPIEERCING